jgi:tetratricopeptide (TPR) repeat protein
MMIKMIARAIIVSLAVSFFGSVPTLQAQARSAKVQHPTAVASTAPSSKSAVKSPQQNLRVNQLQPTIQFVLPKSDETIANYPIHVQVKVSNFELLPPVQYYRAMSSHRDMMKGHIHYSFDDAPALATDETSLNIEANGTRTLPAGPHVLRAELRAMNHKALNPPVFAMISFNCQPAEKVATPPADPKIAKLLQNVGQLQAQVRELQGGTEKGSPIGNAAGEGNALAGKGNYLDAEAKYKEALALIPQRLALNELTDKTAAILQAHILAKMGILYTKKKDYPGAESAFAEATRLFEDNAVDSPVARRHHVECLRAYAELLRAENQPDKAKDMDARADKIKL